MEYIIFAIVAYLLGSIPSGLLVGKIGYNKDIREYGSGNLGATNTFRTLGIRAGIIVTLADILKGTLATTLPLFFDANVYILLIGIFAAIGHMFPIFARFKGGKAVATSGGIILGVNPILFLIVLATFFITLYISKYVSLSSMTTCVVGFITVLIIGDLGLIIVILALSFFIFYRHWANIKRIKNKTEPKITWM